MSLTSNDAVNENPFVHLTETTLYAFPGTSQMVHMFVIAGSKVDTHQHSYISLRNFDRGNTIDQWSANPGPPAKFGPQHIFEWPAWPRGYERKFPNEFHYILFQLYTIKKVIKIRG